jgi:hypothetical protein
VPLAFSLRLNGYRSGSGHCAQSAGKPGLCSAPIIGAKQGHGGKRDYYTSRKTETQSNKKNKTPLNSLPSPFFFSLGFTILVFFFLRSWSIVDLEEFYSFLGTRQRLSVRNKGTEENVTIIRAGRQRHSQIKRIKPRAPRIFSPPKWLPIRKWPLRSKCRETRPLLSTTPGPCCRRRMDPCQIWQ